VKKSRGRPRKCSCGECKTCKNREYRRTYEKKNGWDVRRKEEFSLFLSILKSVGCSVCGEDDERCLDLHHRNPDEKLFSLHLGNQGRSKSSWRTEAKKCVVLCANCHRKLGAHGNAECCDIMEITG